MTAVHSSLSGTTRLLHWIIAVALVGMISFGLYIASQPSGPDKTALIQTHKSCGVIIGFLALLRLGWRVHEGFPSSAAGLSGWILRASRAAHSLMLILPILIPLVGIMASLTYARPVKVFGVPFIPQLLNQKHEHLNEMFSLAHMTLGWLLTAIILLHMAAALYHHFGRGDQTLSRMLGI